MRVDGSPALLVVLEVTPRPGGVVEILYLSPRGRETVTARAGDLITVEPRTRVLAGED